MVTKAKRIAPSKGDDFETPAIVTILTGPESAPKSFTVQGSVLRRRSKFFDAALNGNWSASTTGTVELYDWKPETVLMYLNLVFHNVLTIDEEKDERNEERTDAEDSTNNEAEDSADAEDEYVEPDEENEGEANDADTDPAVKSRAYTNLAELYVLAEFLQDNDAKDTIVCEFFNHQHFGTKRNKAPPPPEAVRTIYEGTLEGDKCRQLMLHLYTINIDDTGKIIRKAAAQSGTEYPQEFLMDVLGFVTHKNYQYHKYRTLTIWEYVKDTKDKVEYADLVGYEE